MISFLRQAILQFSPPILLSVTRRLLRRRSARGEWEFAGYAWPDELPTRGWNVPSVVNAQRRRWPVLVDAVRGVGPLADSVAVHNTLACFGYVVGRASISRSRVSILDWGGGLGQYGVIAAGLFPELAIEYHCHDLPLMTEAGRELVPQTHFHADAEETLAATYDLVMASSSLQYARDWRSTLARLAGSTRKFLYVPRHPTVLKSRSFVAIQRPDAQGYDTEYLGWVLNRGEFVAAAESAGVILRREFIIGEDPYIPDAPEQPVYGGFLFERTHREGGG